MGNHLKPTTIAYVLLRMAHDVWTLIWDLFFPSEAYHVAIKAFKEARSDTFDDDWTHIVEHDRHGYVRVWNSPELEAESDEADNLFDKEIVCRTAAEFSQILNGVPKPQDGSRLVYVVEGYDDHVQLPWDSMNDGTDDFLANNRTSSSSVNSNVNGSDGRDSRAINSRHDGGGEDSHTRSSTSQSYYSYTDSLFGTSSAMKCNYTISIMSLLSRNNDPTIWYRMESFEILLKPGKKWEDLYFARVERSILFQRDQNHAKVWIQCKTSEPTPNNEEFVWGPSRGPFQVTSSFANHLHGLDPMYNTFRNRSSWIELLSLQYYHATLMSYSEFIVAYEEWYTKLKQPLLDPRRSDFKLGHLKEITKQSFRIQHIRRAGERMMEAVEYLAEIAQGVAANQPRSAGTSTTSKGLDESRLMEIQLELRGYCIEIRGCLSRLSASLEHDIKFLGLRREMKQTNSVQRLTILATIFLPLSLSAGVLSMQTRFKDLGALLYDFFGVVVLLGALVVPLMVFLEFLNIATDHVLVDLDLRMGSSTNGMRQFLSGLMWLGITMFATLVLVSFILGMFKDVGLGARILGYGTVVFSFPLVSMMVLVWSYIFLRWLWKLRKSRRQSQRQTESESGSDEEAVRASGAVARTTAPIQLRDTPLTSHQAANASKSQVVSP